MKKFIIIALAVLTSMLTVNAQQRGGGHILIKNNITPKVELGGGLSSKGSLAYAGFGANWDHFALTLGGITFARTIEVNVNSVGFAGLFAKVDVNIVSMAERGYANRIEIRPFVMVGYGKKYIYTMAEKTEEKSGLFSPGLNIGYRVGKIGILGLVQYAGFKSEVTNKTEGEFYFGLSLNVPIGPYDKKSSNRKNK